MPNDDFSPNFSKLDGDYQVLTELHREGDSRAYLARHLRLNRDVTISVFCVADGISADSLSQFASDARLLTEARHPHVVPVIDGIWLDDATFAAVRARVRGATLDQSLHASGPMSIARVAATMHDVVGAILWGREIGVAQRDVAPWDIVFQQGSGRILLSFEPARNSSNVARTACDDARTIRRLAIEMLAGEIDRSKSADEIAVPRSIPSDVADALAALRHATPRNANTAVTALVTALDAAAAGPTGDEKTQIAPSAATPVVTGPVIDPLPEREVPTMQAPADSPARRIAVVTSVPHHRRGSEASRDDVVIMTKPAFGFNARFATAVVVLAAAAGIGFLALNRNGSPAPTTTASAPATDTGSNSAGEVVLHTTPSPAAPASQSGSRNAIDSSRANPRKSSSATSGRSDSSATTRKRTDDADAAKAPRKRVAVDSAAEAERQFQRDSAADVADPCASADRSDQSRCLMAAIDRNDRELNRVYARLISALRRQASAASADPDPDSVNELRADQRKWVDARDAACRDVGEGPLFAKSRAACFAQQSADRARELQRRLDAIPPAT
jgi:uncharacterized protein YecT (DUF1311 family)